jgi:hypothetical protein
MSRRLFIKLGFDLKAFSKSSQNIARSLKKTGKQMKNIGKSMTMSLTAPIVAMGGLAVKVFADFEQSMAKVQAVSGATGAEFQKLNTLAKDLGISTRFTATQVSDLMLNYSKLGFSSGEIEKITESTLDLALATGEDLATSAEVAGSTLRGFGLEATEMQSVVDVMAKSFSSSALNLEKFGTSMAVLAPVAKNANVSLEQATGFLSILTDRGVDASTAGTGLRNIFLDLAGSGQTLESAMSEIANSTNKNKTAFDMFGKRGATVAAIMADNAEEARGLTEAYKNSAGAAAEMAAIMDNTLEGSMMKVKSALEGLGISFGEVLGPHIKKAAAFISDLAIKFSELNPETKKIIVTVAALAAAIGPLIFIIGSLTVALGFLAANPIVLIIGVLVAGFVALKIAASETNKIFGYVQIASEKMAVAYDSLGKEIDKINVLKGRGTLASKDEIKLSLISTRATIASTNALIKENLERKKKLLALKEAAMAIAMQSTRAVGRQGEFIDVELAKVKGLEANIAKITGEIKKLQTQGGTAVDGLIDLENQLKSLGNTEIKNDFNVDTDIKIKPKLNVKQAKTSISEAYKGLGDILGSMKIKESFNPNVRIDLSNVKIDVSTLPDILTEAEEIGIEISDAFNAGLERLIVQSADLMGEFVGNMITGSDKVARQDFGKAFLGMIGGFMQEFGAAIIGIGLAKSALDAAITSGNAPIAIVAGVALVAAGAVLSSVSKKGVDGNGGGGGGGIDAAPAPSYSGGGQDYSMNTGVRISGRDLILVQERERAFRR